MNNQETLDMYFYFALILTILNVILSICLFSPNIVYFIHKKWFKWRIDKSDYIKGAKDYCESPLPINTFINKIK